MIETRSQDYTKQVDACVKQKDVEYFANGRCLSYGYQFGSERYKVCTRGETKYLWAFVACKGVSPGANISESTACARKKVPRTW